MRLRNIWYAVVAIKQAIFDSGYGVVNLLVSVVYGFVLA